MSKVNIYGASEIALKYLVSNPEISVNCFIEGKKNINTYMGYKVVQALDAEKELKSSYTLVASTINSYWQIKNFLESEYGLFEFESFEHIDTYKKKIAVIYGNCHALAIRSAIEQSKYFNREYGLYPLKGICDIKRDNGLSLNTKVFDKCDLFIHQAIRRNNSYGIEYSSDYIMNKIKHNCRIISIPNLYQLPKFLFPQVYDVENEKRIESINYFSNDLFLDNNHNCKDLDLILDIINDCNLVDSKVVLNGYDEFIAKVMKRENQWDIKVSDFIISNIKEKQLFYDPNHPTEYIIEYISNELLKLLGYDEYVFPSIILDDYERPIYNAVKNALGLKYRIKYIRKTGFKLSNNQMDIREYIRQYLLWNYNIKL